MKAYSALLILAKVLAIAALAGCATPTGKLKVDTTILPYQAPDISEITGIEEPDPGEESDETGSASAPEPGK
jgi:hypothetical protein